MPPYVKWLDELNHHAELSIYQNSVSPPGARKRADARRSPVPITDGVHAHVDVQIHAPNQHAVKSN